ncbi:MAG: hypothetical protein IJ600_01185 [Lachnospiraceae bacterium]|nr:hypothetical protein [Lachnospiraceae bacterium]
MAGNEIELLHLKQQVQNLITEEVVLKINSAAGESAHIAEQGTKMVGGVSFVLSAIIAGKLTVEDITQYSAGLEVVNQYEYILNELMHCGDLNIEDAAQKVNADLNDTISKYKRYAMDGCWDIGHVGLETGSSAILATLGIPGILIDLGWLLSGIVAGKSGSNKIINHISVECVNAVTMATKRLISSGDYQITREGDMIIVVTSDSEKIIPADTNPRMWGNTFINSKDLDMFESVKEMMQFNSFAWKWSEEKYRDYLTDNSLGFDGDFFFEKENKGEDVIKNAEVNIANMERIRESYLEYER